MFLAQPCPLHMPNEGLHRVRGFWLTIALLWSAIWLAAQAWWLYRKIIDPLVPILHRQGWWQREGSLHLLPGPLLAFLVPALALYVIFAWANSNAFQRLLLPHLQRSREKMFAFLGQLLLTTLTLSLLSAWMYPTSVMGDALGLVLIHRSTRCIAIVLGIAVTAYFLWWLGTGMLRLPRLAKWVLASLLITPLALPLSATGRSSALPGQSPNIILIGIDSLRPDHLRKFGAPFNVAPNIEAFLRDSVAFSDALTTQAHTFPATTSILTGLYPTSSGARGNLFPPSLIKTGHSIAWRFRSGGWRTVYGTDETRFANIDGLYGFEDITGPGLGLPDYLMSFVSDSVLVNLLSNTTAGRWLFPHLYGNRAVSQVYRPESFSRQLELTLDHSDARPLFLYAHFCSGHWPYEPASLFGEDFYEHLPVGQWADTNTAYLRAIAKADSQVGLLLKDLKERGRLENAIVVLFSDHGEDFGMQKDVIRNDTGESLQSGLNGHGSSAVRLPQVRVLLAWQRYGEPQFPARTTSLPVSLVDIAPTLASLASLSSASSVRYDGVSLVPALKGEAQSELGDRIRFVESSAIFQALQGPTINVGSAIAEAGSNFGFSRNGRVEVLPEFIAPQISHRERAAWSGNKIAMLPADPEAAPLLLDRQQLHWQPATPEVEPSKALMASLCKHWESDAVAKTRCAGWGISSAVAAGKGRAP